MIRLPPVTSNHAASLLCWKRGRLRMALLEELSPGVLVKGLMIRGDLRRCLIVAPGNLVEQWQDELNQRFHIVFDILTNDRLEASASGNAFVETPLCIARLDKLSRDEQVQEKLRQTEWDLIVVDEAHKMSATFFGGEMR